MPHRRALLAVPLALLALAPSAHAAEYVFGSDLQADATIDYAEGEDWAAWNTSLASGGAVVSPVQGEVNLVNLKGRMILEGREQKPPATDPPLYIRVMVLKPKDDGTVTIAADTSISEALPFPTQKDPNYVTTYNRSQLTRPDNADGKGGSRLCIEKGDYIAFTTTGGFGGFAHENPEQIYVDGTHFQVFGTARSTSMNHSARGAYAYNSPFRGSPFGGRELLLNATVGTGRDARYTCRTAEEKAQNLDAAPAASPAPTTATPGPATTGPSAVPSAPIGQAALVNPRKAPKVKGKKVKLAIECSTVGACSGTIALRTYARATRFALAAGETGQVTLKINKRARKKLKRRGSRLTVKAMLVTADGYKQNLRFKIKRV